MPWSPTGIALPSRMPWSVSVPPPSRAGRIGGAKAARSARPKRDRGFRRPEGLALLLAQFTRVLTSSCSWPRSCRRFSDTWSTRAPSHPSSRSTRHSGFSRSIGQSSSIAARSAWPPPWCESAGMARSRISRPATSCQGTSCCWRPATSYQRMHACCAAVAARQEAALTGESEAVEGRQLGLRRRLAPSVTGATWSIPARSSAMGMARESSRTGIATELGKIAGLLQSVTREPTPLQSALTSSVGSWPRRR